MLSNWLAGHGVTHVAIKPSAGSWKPLYRALQQAFTVLLIDPAHATEVDIQRIADLLAYGLVQSQVITPSALQEAPHTHPHPSTRSSAVIFLLAHQVGFILRMHGFLLSGQRIPDLP